MDHKGHLIDPKGLRMYEKRQKKMEFLDPIHLLFSGIFLSGIRGYPPHIIDKTWPQILISWHQFKTWPQNLINWHQFKTWPQMLIKWHQFKSRPQKLIRWHQKLISWHQFNVCLSRA